MTSRADMDVVWNTALGNIAISVIGIAVNVNADDAPIGLSDINRHAVPNTTKSI